MKLYAYKQGSESAKALSQALGIKHIKHEGKQLYVNETLINWGSSNIVRDIRLGPIGQCLNSPGAVACASNKLSAFINMDIEGVSIPEFTTDLLVANDWLNQGCVVVARTKLNGHSGEGIHIFGPDDEAVNAPLYTKYIKKTQEYRVHVMHGRAFFVQRKARKKDVPDEQVNWQVRNLNGGFIFAHISVELPEEATVQAVRAVEALGLDFGAVDLIETKDKQYYVLEVNTAPGLEGTNLEKYVAEFKKYQ